MAADADELRQLAQDLEFYATTADGSPEMVRAVGVELAAIAKRLMKTPDQGETHAAHLP